MIQSVLGGLMPPTVQPDGALVKRLEHIHRIIAPNPSAYWDRERVSQHKTVRPQSIKSPDRVHRRGLPDRFARRGTR